MLELDHPCLPVTDVTRSREWYVGTLGMKVEFAISDRHAVALQDGEGFTIFLEQAPAPISPRGCALWFLFEGEVTGASSVR